MIGRTVTSGSAMFLVVSRAYLGRHDSAPAFRRQEQVVFRPAEATFDQYPQ